MRTRRYTEGMLIVDRPTDTELSAVVEHAIRHAEPLPPGVLSIATSNQLDSVAKMLAAGGFHADAQELRQYARVGCRRCSTCGY
jgi:hypothetical protein